MTFAAMVHERPTRTHRCTATTTLVPSNWGSLCKRLALWDLTRIRLLFSLVTQNGQKIVILPEQSKLTR